MSDVKAQRRTGLANAVSVGSALAIVLSFTAFAHHRWHTALAILALGAIAANWFFIAFRRRDGMSAAWGAYIVIVAIGVLVEDASKHPPKVALALVGAASAIAFGAGLVVLFRRLLALQEVEQKIVHHATMVAFGLTVLVLATTALIAGFLETGYPTPWVFFAAGLGTWVIALIHFRNKYT